MGIKPFWYQSVFASFKESGIDLQYIQSLCYDLISFGHHRLIINLVPLNNEYNAMELVALQEEYRLKGIYLVHLWEDMWQNRQDQVIGRIFSIIGLNKRIHARKTTIVKINQQQADVFFKENHLLASANAKYKIALVADDRIVAVASFSNFRSMKKMAPGYKSVELIRFASLTGYTVTGGFSKLLKYFINEYKPDDIMSYADRDWSLGKAYEKAGFKLSAITPPLQIWLRKDNFTRYFLHRLPKDLQGSPNGTVKDAMVLKDDYFKIFNTGNLKYILYL